LDHQRHVLDRRHHRPLGAVADRQAGQLDGGHPVLAYEPSQYFDGAPGSLRSAFFAITSMVSVHFASVFTPGWPEPAPSSGRHRLSCLVSTSLGGSFWASSTIASMAPGTSLAASAHDFWVARTNFFSSSPRDLRVSSCTTMPVPSRFMPQ